jgi:hypothetical protein
MKFCCKYHDSWVLHSLSLHLLHQLAKSHGQSNNN